MLLKTVIGSGKEQLNWKQDGLFAEIDQLFAERILFPYVHSESVQAFLAYLMAASRKGHICVKVGGEINPSPLILGDEGQGQYLEKAIKEGSESLPSEIVDEAPSLSSCPMKPICKDGDRFYLQRNWLLETAFLQQVLRLKQAPPLLQPQTAFEVESLLNAGQKQAIQASFSNAFVLITGGPGTGKTFTAAHLVKAFLKAMPSERAQKFRIVLTAPTGRAAAHLEAKIKAQIDVAANLRVGTVHAVLGVRPNPDFFEEAPYLPADLVIVDECSMIDLPLFHKLLAAIPSGARLVLMGDGNQLPAVENGSLFADLAELSNLLTVVELSKSMRSNQSSILSFAEAVRLGDANAVKAILGKNDGVVKRVNVENRDARSVIDRYWDKIFHNFSRPAPDLAVNEELLKQLLEFRILSCMRRGDLGVDALNREIALRFYLLAQPGDLWPAPIIITRSDAKAGLYNGDVGILVRNIVPGSSFGQIGADDYALFSDSTGAIRRLPAYALKNFEYAYCLSVHKSQGSEYEQVLLFVPKGSESFGREVLYTAVTRARKSIEIEISDEVLFSLLHSSSRKISGLNDRMKTW